MPRRVSYPRTDGSRRYAPLTIRRIGTAAIIALGERKVLRRAAHAIANDKTLWRDTRAPSTTGDRLFNA